LKYLSNTTPLNNNWYLKKYDDSSWNTNKIGFGFGDDSTILRNVNSIFLRKNLLINDSSNISYLILHIDYDDGYSAYLNGQ
jgi:hypothetical protein